MELVYSIFCLAVLAILTYKYMKFKKFFDAVNQIPGAPVIPILGNALEINYGGADYRVDMMLTFSVDLYPEAAISRLWIGPFPLVTIVKASAAEVVLSSMKHIDKGREYNFLHSWLGTGLLTSTGSKWHSRRKLLTGAFHFKILEDFLSVFNEQSNIFTAKIGEVNAKGEAFDIFPYITRCTLDIICESAMGKNVNAQSVHDSPYVKAVYAMSRVVMARMTKPWLRPDFLYCLSSEFREEKRSLRTLHGFTDSVIREKRQNFVASGQKKRRAFLDLLLDASEDGKVLSDADIREEVDTFMFEGHDTTSAAISWCLWLLGLHPKLQQRCHDELDSIFGNSDRPVTTDDLSKMKFLECCIKETLRLYPSVPFIARELKEDLIIEDKHIPAGVTLLVMIMVIQRDPAIFKNPHSFIPDRFMSSEDKDRNPFAFVPFSAGPRNCIGQKFAMMEEKVVISSVLRKFKVISAENIDRITFHAELILRSKRGIKVKLEPRSF